MTEKLFMSVKLEQGNSIDLPSPINTVDEAVNLAKELKAKELIVFKKVAVQKFSERDLYGVVHN